MKKKVFLLIVLIILTGCTAKSNVTMDYNGKIKEEVTILDNNKNILYGNYDINDSIDLKITENKTILDYRKYGYDKIIKKYKSGVKVYKQYKNICDYFQNTAFNHYLFNHIKCSENDYYYEIFNDTAFIPYESYYEKWNIPEVVTFNLTLPVKAEESNADKEVNNVYTWNFNTNTKEKNFNIKISKEVLNQNLKKNIKNQEKALKIKKIKIVVGVMVVTIIILGLSIFIIKKAKDNKKFDY